MTFEQKIIVKKSKKGFTLVELVVVIAVLAVLAAVAIPMITGIIKSATDSARESDAATLNQACKNFVASIAAGTITQESVSAASLSFSSAKLPSKSSTASYRTSAANAFTVQEVCDYNGLNNIWATIGDFGYIDAQTPSATIVYKGTCTTTPINNIDATTTMSSIYVRATY